MSAATSRDNASPDPPKIKRNTVGSHELRAWCVAPFPDNEHVVSASDDDTVVVWNFRTQQKERCWTHKGATTVAVSRDGKKVVSGGRDCALQLWSAESGEHLAGPWKLHKERVWSVSWSPDGNHIASCSADSTLIICNAGSGELILGPLPTEQDAVHAVAYSPDGKNVATGGQDFTIKIWDARTGRLQATLRGHTMAVSSVAWTKDGSQVISGSVDHTVRIWGIAEGKEVCPEIQAHSHAINYIAVSAHVFVTASINHAYLWSLKTRRRLSGPFELSRCDEANCVALSDDENTIAACTERGKVYTWNIGKITSAIQKEGAEDSEFSDIGDVDVTGSPYYDSDLPDGFFSNTRSNAFQGTSSRAQNGIRGPVKRGVTWQRLVAPLRIPRPAVVDVSFARLTAVRTKRTSAGRRSEVCISYFPRCLLPSLFSCEVAGEHYRI
ncbi:WD40-repeat-containing domain protein [Suillus clintonianus]|uniref:WD40-repeat-containing domain protein n=1 Tax=Suillus clintonianus TaxID=1904413 RepID=UPI001B85BBF0|nr:WD40-repeat-containing domain protein [Suillus clintonianus]KAG2154040.1 WD40-repeat-containing domain protein [Suillus clintonianus]